jgi:sec-independent protein translocase protein TatB
VPLNLSFTHIIVVAIVALVVLGPERLPGVARTAGNLYREWKRISGGLEAEVREVFADFAEPFTSARDDVSAPITDLRTSIATSLRGSSTTAGDTEDGPMPAASPSAIPSLGPSTGLVSPGPTLEFRLPELAPAPQPDTFVPFPPAGGEG